MQNNSNDKRLSLDNFTNSAVIPCSDTESHFDCEIIDQKETLNQVQSDIETPTSPWRGCHEVTGEGKSNRPSLEFLSSLPFANKFFSLRGEMKAKAAFTLAEVLITIAVVGVVAAITLPTLIQNAKEKATVAKVRETYAILSQAYRHATEENGDITGWYTGTWKEGDAQGHIDQATPMKKYMKLANDCVGKGDTYAYNHCSTHFYESRLYAPVKLLNGVVVAFHNWNINCTTTVSKYKNNSCGYIKIELEPNKASKNGENTFEFFVTSEGIVPFGKPDSYITFEKGCNKSIANPSSWFHTGQNMFECTAWVIYQGNMNYLHCDDLSWSGKTSCGK